MYRILIATSGYYYVQKETRFGWQKVGGFFNTKSGAKRFIRDHRSARLYSPVNYVVGYY